jgi:hypothetical protein
MDFDMTDLINMTRTAAKFTSSARKLRDGLDDLAGRMTGMSVAAGTLSRASLDLADAAPNGAGELVQMLGAVAGILAGFGRTVGETGNDMRAGADAFSRKIRAFELEARKETR